jgi:sigma-B regulation protein RsbU (phosphoserine phosphatase)
VVEDGEYGERTLSLRSGDLMLVYSDGVTDATCSGGKAFGHDGIAAVLANLQPLTVEGIVRDLAGVVREHEQGTAQSDDVTILAVQFHGPPQ